MAGGLPISFSEYGTESKRLKYLLCVDCVGQILLKSWNKNMDFEADYSLHISERFISQPLAKDTLRCEVKEKMTPLSGRVLLPRAPKVGHHVGSCCWSGPAYKSRSALDRSYTPSPGPPRSLASSRASNRVLCNEAGGGGLGTPAWSSRPPTGAILANFYREYKVNTSYLVSRGWAWGEVEANNVKRLCYQWMLHIPELVPIKRVRDNDLFSRNSRINRIWFCIERGKAVDLWKQ